MPATRVKFACEEALDRAFALKRRKTIKRTRVKPRDPDLEGESPIKRQLKETETWTKDEMHIFPHLPTSRERANFTYDILPDDATGLDRLWPIAIVQKDSRLRRRLCDKGKEAFLNGNNENVLHYYNEACLYSSSKGLGHTLARRAAFLLQNQDYELALRDIRLALELGCLESELLDFLLSHHVSDDQKVQESHNGTMDKSVSVLNDPDIRKTDKGRFATHLRVQLQHIRNMRKVKPTEEERERVINEVKEFVMSTKPSTEKALRPEVAPPTLDSVNPKFPSFSSSIRVEVDSDKGRKVMADEDIQLGDIIMVEKPNTLFFCPETEKLSMLKNHCLHCLRYSKAPLPCEECCVISFCSEACKREAKNSYHKYECKMKLYEMLHFMGDEFLDTFMAIRTITQHPVEYFMEREEEIWKILEMEFPEIQLADDSWESDSIEALLRLMSHQKDIDEWKLMQNAVIAVFFFRALQAANYFQSVVPKKSWGDRRLAEPEILILCILNQVINIQASHAEPFTRLVSAAKKDDVYFQLEIGRKFFEWERIGSCISASLGLINHSCDPNCIRFFMGDHIVLVASKFIPKDSELTISYDSIHHESTPLFDRQLHLIRKFFFSCECPACKGDWCQYDSMPDKLYHVPNFDTEWHFKVRIGDKKDLVNEIDFLKLESENFFRNGRVVEALEDLKRLSYLLEENINKPHQYHAQANQAARLCIKMLYLRDAIDSIKDIDFSTRVPPLFVNGELKSSAEQMKAKHLKSTEVLDKNGNVISSEKVRRRNKSCDRTNGVLLTTQMPVEVLQIERQEPNLDIQEVSQTEPPKPVKLTRVEIIVVYESEEEEDEEDSSSISSSEEWTETSASSDEEESESEELEYVIKQSESFNEKAETEPQTIESLDEVDSGEESDDESEEVSEEVLEEEASQAEILEPLSEPAAKIERNAMPSFQEKENFSKGNSSSSESLIQTGEETTSQSSITEDNLVAESNSTSSEDEESEIAVEVCEVRERSEYERSTSSSESGKDDESILSEVRHGKSGNETKPPVLAEAEKMSESPDSKETGEQDRYESIDEVVETIPMTANGPDRHENSSKTKESVEMGEQILKYLDNDVKFNENNIESQAEQSEVGKIDETSWQEKCSQESRDTIKNDKTSDYTDTPATHLLDKIQRASSAAKRTNLDYDLLIALEDGLDRLAPDSRPPDNCCAKLKQDTTVEAETVTMSGDRERQLKEKVSVNHVTQDVPEAHATNGGSVHMCHDDPDPALSKSEGKSGEEQSRSREEKDEHGKVENNNLIEQDKVSQDHKKSSPRSDDQWITETNQRKDQETAGRDDQRNSYQIIGGNAQSGTFKNNRGESHEGEKEKALQDDTEREGSKINQTLNRTIETKKSRSPPGTRPLDNNLKAALFARLRGHSMEAETLSDYLQNPEPSIKTDSSDENGISEPPLKSILKKKQCPFMFIPSQAEPVTSSSAPPKPPTRRVIPPPPKRERVPPPPAPKLEPNSSPKMSQKRATRWL